MLNRLWYHLDYFSDHLAYMLYSYPSQHQNKISGWMKICWMLFTTNKLACNRTNRRIKPISWTPLPSLWIKHHLINFNNMKDIGKVIHILHILRMLPYIDRLTNYRRECNQICKNAQASMPTLVSADQIFTLIFPMFASYCDTIWLIDPVLVMLKVHIP